MSLHQHGLRVLAMIAAILTAFGAVVFSSSAQSVESTIFNYLTDRMDFNSAAACGVLANIEKESSFNPNIYGDNGTSYGICQWHAVRFNNLRRYCETNSLDYTTLEGQLEFLNYELSSLPKTMGYLRSVPDTPQGAYDAAYYWCYNFEIPANREENSQIRGELARTKYWPIFGGSVLPDETAPFEVWQVNTDKLNIRTGPGTEYPQVSIWTRDSQLHITGVAILESGEIWGKTRLGWSDMSYMSYVSGNILSVRYITGCAQKMAQTPVSIAQIGQSFTLPNAPGLSRHGYSFVGWSADGTEVLSPGSSVEITENTTVRAIWERDSAVTLIRGDANCDTKLNAKDVTMIMQYLLGNDVPISVPCADVDTSGQINARDITLLMKVILGSATIDPVISAEDEARYSVSTEK